MMYRCLLLLLFFSLSFGYNTYAQQPVPLPHGMIFGDKPDTANALNAFKLHDFMGAKKRISTVLKGKVVKVTKEQGGWFELDADSGRTVAAHFKNYNVVLPKDITGRTVILQGVAKRQFRAAVNQHFAGDTVADRKNGQLQPQIMFEVKGLMIYQ